MTDIQWQKTIDKCVEAGIKHNRLLTQAEEEYIRRYGSGPSERGDDWWIDALHYCNGDTNVDKIKQAAESRARSSSKK